MDHTEDHTKAQPDHQPDRPLSIDRRHPIARRIIARWRHLIAAAGGSPAGEPTLIACSGGADSTALALALGSTGVRLALVFAEHDARPREVVLRDRARVELLASALGADFHSVDCTGISSGQPSEGEMRSARYAAMSSAARAGGFRFVATGHHADDQLETMLLALIRGGGPRGMSGMPERRTIDPLEPEIILLRPMLVISRAECEALCTDAGLRPPSEGEPAWADDQTNSESAYLRNRVRQEIVPRLEDLRPGVAVRAARNAEWFRQMESVLRDRAAMVSESARRADGAGVHSWDRGALRTEPPIVIGQILREALADARGRRGLDRLDAAKVGRISSAVADQSTEAREFEIGDGCSVTVRARAVELRMKKPRAGGASE